MEEFQIQSAQNIGIKQNIAPITSRIFAYIIDGLIQFFYMLAMVFLLGLLELDFRDYWAFYMVLTLPIFLYYLLFESLWNGQTIGKNAMQIRVVQLDGSKPSFASYSIRWLFRIIDVILTSGGVAIVTILLNGKGQRLGDIAAGTTVISLKKRIDISNTLMQFIPPNYQPKYPQVTLFKDVEMQAIKSIYETAKKTENHAVILKLKQQLTTVMQVTPEELPIDFINTVIKDYNYYTQKM